ncbi:MAG: pyrroline-5-carboxylate reductase [Clostridia bacterium]|nr:pyrroline-5-carboxylate reductase [Clostridia bacterium]
MQKMGFIGCGNMGSAILEGMLEKHICDREDLLIHDISDAVRDRYAQKGICVADSIEALANGSDIIFLAVKPQYFPDVAGELRQYLDYHLLISIMAGITIERIREALGEKCRIIRVMPNTPLMVGEGMSAMCPDEHVRQEDKAFADKVFSSLGTAQWVTEKAIDGVCGLSGSGPAFVAMMIEAMADGAVYEGMARKDALRSAAQTVLGTAKLVLEKDIHPAVLKDMVSSPAGTTIEGVRELEENGFRAAVMSAVIKATEKSKKM